jgi:hypothetical protein
MGPDLKSSPISAVATAPVPYRVAAPDECGRYRSLTVEANRWKAATACRMTLGDCSYFFISSNTAAVIAFTPVRIVGSGTGANIGE